MIIQQLVLISVQIFDCTLNYYIKQLKLHPVFSKRGELVVFHLSFGTHFLFDIQVC